MIQSSAAQPGELDEIVARLIKTFQPTRIILFGSRARGDARPDSDYDFLVESDERPEGMMIMSDGMTWLEDFPEIEIQVHLRSPGALERRQNDPGWIDWDVVREGRLVYSERGQSMVPVSKPKLVKENTPKPPESLEDWMAHAERNLRLAVHLSADVAAWKEDICFNSQQAAEKFLKALIISRHQRPARTHKLRVLLAHLRKIGVALEQLDEDCGYLTPFGSERYPPKTITETHARDALPAAERIAAAVRSRLP